jgi:hypothetical protein
MGSDAEEEIRASVGAHRDLGPDYDDVVAQGLVERIGAEIDRRIDERLGYRAAVRPPAAPQFAPQHQQTPPAAKPTPAGAAQRSVATTITALGSMALGVGATSIVSSSSGSPGIQAFLVLVIWIAIVIINVAYARHR